MTGGSGSGSRPPPLAPPDSASVEESSLVERVRGGDSVAFDALVRRYEDRALALGYRLLRNREEAEDLVQESFLTALERIDSFRRGSDFAPWFFRILVNRGLNRRKALRVRDASPLSEELAESGESPEATAARREIRERVWRALGALTDKQRLAVQLFELEGFSGREVAEALDMRETTVRGTLHDARKRLRRILSQAGGEATDV